MRRGNKREPVAKKATYTVRLRCGHVHRTMQYGPPQIGSPWACWSDCEGEQKVMSVQQVVA